MEITFRGSELLLDEDDYCLEISDSQGGYSKQLTIRDGKRFNFDSQTRNYFNSNKPNEDMTDICHCYSFNCLEKYLCNSYTYNREDNLEKLLKAMYLVDNVTANAEAIDGDGYSAAYNICALLVSGEISFEDEELLFNMLLYVLNNAITNLRWGYGGPNRSIGAAYDPISWEYDSENSRFLITSDWDTYRISTFEKVPFKKSTLSFYTAVLHNDDDDTDEYILYSSSNEDFTSTDDYSECTDGIALKMSDGSIHPLDLSSEEEEEIKLN